MKKLLCATNNPSKKKYFERLIDKNELKLVTIDELEIRVNVIETGSTPVENALLKAQAFYEATQLPSIAFDSALYFEDFAMDDSIQPKDKIRRINGKTLNDDEMINYYMEVARMNGGKLSAYYVDGYALVNEDGIAFTYQSQNNKAFSFYIVDKQHKTMVEGGPLNSISVSKQSLRYYYDISEDDQELQERRIKMKLEIDKLKEFVKKGLLAK